MAITTEFARPSGKAPPEGGRIAIAGDRRVAFRRARWHSAWVAFLRAGLPLASLAMVAFYGLSVWRMAALTEPVTETAKPVVDPLNLTMHNPRYEGFNTDGGKYVVQAATAQQDLTRPGVYALAGITGRTTHPDGATTDIKARRGIYESTSGVLDLFEEIDVAGSTGLKARMTRARVETKEAIVTSTEPVTVEMPTAVVNAERMTLRQRSREVTFSGNVRTKLIVPDKPAPQADGAAQARNFGAGGGPIDIDSQRLDLDDTRKTALFTGNVRARQGDSAMASPEMLVTYRGDAAPAPGQPRATPGEPGRVDRILAKGPVSLARGLVEQAQGDALEFDGATETTVLNGNVTVTQGPERRVTSDRAELDAKAETALFTGVVSVIQGKTELHGGRLHIEQRTGRSKLSAPGANGGKPGRIRAHIVRAEGAADATIAAKPAVSNPADAMAAFKADPKAPVDVEADFLDGDDRSKRAVFKGDVKAVQGELTVRTSELTVHYTGSAKPGAEPARDAAPAALGGAGAQVSRIEARHKVILVGKNGQTATGDWADFDTKLNKMLMGGDVLLSQAGNVVRGAQLAVDMDSGEARVLTSAANTGWVGGQPAALPARNPQTPGNAPPGMRTDRPSLVFTPGSGNKKPGVSVLPAAPAPTASPAPGSTSPDASRPRSSKPSSTSPAAEDVFSNPN